MSGKSSQWRMFNKLCWSSKICFILFVQHEPCTSSSSRAYSGRLRCMMKLEGGFVICYMIWHLCEAMPYASKKDLAPLNIATMLWHFRMYKRSETDCSSVFWSLQLWYLQGGINLGEENERLNLVSVYRIIYDDQLNAQHVTEILVSCPCSMDPKI